MLSRPLISIPLFMHRHTEPLVHTLIPGQYQKKRKNKDIYLRLSRCFSFTHADASTPPAPMHAHSFPFPSHPHACAMPPSQGVSSSHLCRGRQQQRRTDVVGEHARWACTRGSGVDCLDTWRHGQWHQRRPTGAIAMLQVCPGGKSSSSSAWKTEARSGGCCGRSAL